MFLISAGHGDGDPGAVANDVKEADITLDMRDAVAGILRQRGHTVDTDGPEGQSLSRKYSLSLFKKGQIQIDIHCNAATNPLATGVECISLDKDKGLSKKLALAIATTLGLKLRGDAGWIDQSRSARGRLSFVEAGGIIVEMFFLTNKEDLEKYKSNKNKLALAIVDAIT